MTQSGQGGEPQYPAEPPREGIVLPADGSGPWPPPPAPEGGRPWGEAPAWDGDRTPGPVPPQPHPQQQGYGDHAGDTDPYGQHTGGSGYGQPAPGSWTGTDGAGAQGGDPSYGGPQAYGAGPGGAGYGTQGYGGDGFGGDGHGHAAHGTAGYGEGGHGAESGSGAQQYGSGQQGFPGGEFGADQGTGGGTGGFGDGAAGGTGGGTGVRFGRQPGPGTDGGAYGTESGASYGYGTGQTPTPGAQPGPEYYGGTSTPGTGYGTDASFGGSYQDPYARPGAQGFTGPSTPSDPYDPYGQRPPAHGADAEATALIPPVPGGPRPGSAPDAEATALIPPYRPDPAGGSDAEATALIPPVPGTGGPVTPVPGTGAPTGSDAEATALIPPFRGDAGEAATQYIPPVPAGPVTPPAGVRPPTGPPAEFDGLFRKDDEAGSTAQMPRIEDPGGPAAPQRPAPRSGYGYPQPPGPAGYHPQGGGYGYPPQAGHPTGPGYPAGPGHPGGPGAGPAPAPGDRPKRTPVALIAAGVVGLAVVGLGVGALLGGEKGSNSPTQSAAVSDSASPRAGSSEAPAEKPVDPAKAQAVQLDKLLADSGDSREAVIRSVEDIKGCDNLDQAADDLRDAARQREELVTRLEELEIDKLPDHERLAGQLTKAWKSSASADTHYAQWAEQVDGSKKLCKGGKARSTDHARAGNRASGEATKAKQAAAALWNDIAGKYGLTKRDRSQL
ncbi:hypothetical protein [Streptomyces sp. NPDC097619]|uniref:hypothetical protein n=1 Tax=Streptomyces sp. NPDC097619 TaxID=3157228 RepID=UPI00332C447D